MTDTTIYLNICYIYVTLGAAEDLNRFDCYLIEDGHGGYYLKVVLRKDVPEAIIVLCAADNTSDEDDKVGEDDLFGNNFFTRGEPLLRIRNRGSSF